MITNSVGHVASSDLRKWCDQIALMEEAVLDLHHDVSEVRSRLLQTAMKHLIAEGKTELEAREIAERVLSKPSPFMLPTFEELDG